MGQGEEEGAQPYDGDTKAQPPGLAADAPEVADGDEAEDGGNVVGARDEPRLCTGQVKASLNGRNDHTDEPVYYHALKNMLGRING